MPQAISKKETTAVEWLMEEWPALKYQLPKWLVEQTKAMEKEQIIKAYYEGTDTRYTPQQYYNETYNK